ncbi:MAG: prepilin-type N-terminal cleavage/methylation domain-containing protein [Frankiales bacterium]|nr:prepilin-type N-terminal cleavage/methylation domain-containing protein [Frankiales bacterium]
MPTYVFRRIRRAPVDASAGFTLIEIMAALVVLGLVAAGSVAFFVQSIRGVNGQKQRQLAVFLADQELQSVQALPPAKLVTGRTQASVNAIYGSAAATRLNIAAQDDTGNSANYDAAANSGSTPSVPTVQTQTVNNVAYTITTFIDVCWYDNAAGQCGRTSGSGLTQEYRASVDVYWTSTAPCTNGCSYFTSTIIDPTADPQFNSNISAPTIDAITPANETVYNDATTHFVLTGQNYKTGVRVQIQGAGGTITNISQPIATEIDFDLTAGDKPGSYIISIINTDGGHVQTTVNEIPQITAAGSWTSSGRTLTLTGGGFESGATLTMNGSSGGTFTVVGPTSATVANFTGPANGSTATLTVKNPDNTSATWTITAPNVTSSSTSAVAAGRSTSVTLTGTGFRTGLTASASNGSVSISSMTGTSVVLSVTPAAAGTDTLTVYNTDGGTDTYVLTVNPAPTMTGLSPNSVSKSSTVTWTLTGTGFQSGATVSATYKGSARVLSNITINASTITFKFTTTNNTGPITVAVTVTNPDGGTVSGNFTVTAS